MLTYIIRKINTFRVKFQNMSFGHCVDGPSGPGPGGHCVDLDLS